MRAAVCTTYHPSRASTESRGTSGCGLQLAPAATGVAAPALLSERNCSAGTDALYGRTPEYVKEHCSSASGQPSNGSRECQKQVLLQLGVQQAQEEEAAAAAGLSPAKVAAVVVTRRAQTSQVPALEARPAASQHATGLQEGEAPRKGPGTQSVQIHEQGGRVPDHPTGQVHHTCPTPGAGSSRTGPTPSLPTTRTGPSTFANNHMNELIGILREDVGELRSQGTSLAKQLWLLYVTFEDFMHIHHPKRATKLLHSSLSSDNRWSKSTGNLAGYPSAPQLAGKKSTANFLPAPVARDAEREVEVRLTSETNRSELSTPGTMDKLVSGFSKISCLAEEDGDDVLGSRLLGGVPSDTYEGDVTSPGTTSSGYETDQDYMTWQETRMRQGKLFMAALNDARSKKTLVRTGRHQQTNSMPRDEYVIKADDLYHENYTSSSDNDSATYRRVRRAPIVSGHQESHFSGSPHLRQSKPNNQQQKTDTLKVQTEPTLSGGNMSGSGVTGRRRADRIAGKTRRSSTEKNRLSELNKTMQSIISDLGQEGEDSKPDECNDTTLLTPRGGRGEMSLESPETSPSEHWELPGNDTNMLMLAPRPNSQCDSPIEETPMATRDCQGDATYDPLRVCGYEEEGEEEEEGEVELHYPPPHRYPNHPPFYSPQHDDLSARQRCGEWQPHQQFPEMVRPTPHSAHGRVTGVGQDVIHPIHEQSVIQDRVPVVRRQESYHQDITGAHIANKQASSPYQYQHCSSGSISSDSGMASFATGEYSMDYDYGPWTSPALHSSLLKQSPQEESIYETIPDHLVSSERGCRPAESSRQRFSWSGRGAEQLPSGGLGNNYQHHRRPSIDSNATSHTYASIDTQLVTSISDDEGPPPPLLPARNYKRPHRNSADDIRLADSQRMRPGAANWVDRRRGRVRAPLHLDDIVKASDILSDTPGNHMYTVNDVLQSFERLAGHLPTEVPEVRATPHAGTAGTSNPHSYPQVTLPPLPPARYLHDSYSTRMMQAPFHKSQPNLHSGQSPRGKLPESLSEEPWYLQPCPLEAFTMSTPLHRPPPPPTQASFHRQPWDSSRVQALQLRGTYC